jgi:putative sterol carrier protein
MPRFPSIEWAQAFKQAVNDRPEFRAAASDLTADFLFHVKADETLDEDHYIDVLVERGRCTRVDSVDASKVDQATFVLRGPYAEWARLLRGELDPVQAILTRRLEVKGNVARLVRYVAAAKELGRATQAVDTQFL